MANTTDPKQTGTVEATPATVENTTDVSPIQPTFVDPDEYKRAREQYEADEEVRRENPNSAIVRVANPDLGGEHFN